MKFLTDLLPVVLFFIVFKIAGSNEAEAAAFVTHYLSFFIADGDFKPSLAPILLATAVAILISLLQIAWKLVRHQKVDAMLWLSTGIILVFGGATIYFHNDAFIKWKPTILYWAFALAMLIAQFGFNKNIIRLSMEKQVRLPEPVWLRLGLAWTLFFAIMGAVNIYVFSHYSTETWVSFKAFGFLALMIVFIIGQTVYLSRHIKEAP